MLNNSRVGQGDVGHCDDEVSAADVVPPAAVGHVVDPLVLVFQVDVARMLTREPVVASGVGVFSTVDSLDDPPVSCNLKHKNLSNFETFFAPFWAI
jgi:hypothetical protein